MLKSVTLLGSSSGRNAGDAAIIAGIMEAVDEACETRLLYEIPTIGPNYIYQNYQNRVRPVSMFPWHGSLKMLGWPTFQSMLRTDLSILFDAILFDRSLYNPLFNFMSSLYLMIPQAKKRGKRFAGYDLGIGPVDSDHGKQMLRSIIDWMEFVTVRDADSLELIKEVGARTDHVMLAADAALNVQAQHSDSAASFWKTHGISEDQEVLGINVNRYIDTWARPKRPSMGKERFIEVYSQALNQVLSEIDAPVVFVATQHHDLEVTQALISRLKHSKPVVMATNTELNHAEIKAIMSRLSLLVGMRFHSLVLAASEHTPVCGIAYQPKCEYFLRSLGLDERCLHFKDFNVDYLTKFLRSAWADREAIRRTLDIRIPVLKNAAASAAEVVAAMHRGEAIDSIISRKQVSLGMEK